MRNKYLQTAIYFFGIVLTTVIAIAIINPQYFQAIAGNTTKIGADAPPTQLPDVVKQFNSAIENASKAVLPTVVAISVESEQENQFSDFFKDFHPFFGGGDQMPDKQKVQGFGSGVIISSDGYIVTNNHVVDGAVKDGIKVILYDKSEYKAKVVGTDPSTDLAVIKIDAQDLKPAYFADMKDVKVGEFVVAVGNPLGLDFTVTKGIISAIGRGQLQLPKKSNYQIENYIQTDAAINPGNSGGGLFDLSGSLVGINAAIATETGGFMGYGFAIPVDIVKTIVEDLIVSGKVNRPALGVMIGEIDKVTAKSLGLDKVKGVLVNDVIKNSAAAKGGLQSQDVILAIDDTPVNSVPELQSVIIRKKVGEKIKIKIWRDKKEIEKTITLEARNEDISSNDVSAGDNGNSVDNNSSVNFNKLGFTVAPLTKEQKDQLNVSNGVYIVSVKRDSQAAQRGMAPNGVIVTADMQEIKTTGQLKKIIDSKSSGDAIMFKCKYADNTRLIALEID